MLFHLWKFHPRNGGYMAPFFAALRVQIIIFVVGEFLQSSLIGPSWIRWHLSDLGVVASCTVILDFFFGLLRGGFLGEHHKTTKHSLMKCAVLTWTICTIYEYSQEVNEGRGDPVDVICYTISLAVLGITCKIDPTDPDEEWWF